MCHPAVRLHPERASRRAGSVRRYQACRSESKDLPRPGGKTNVSRLAFSGKRCGLTLILAFSEGCGTEASPSSAPGSGEASVILSEGEAGVEGSSPVWRKRFFDSAAKGGFAQNDKRRCRGGASRPCHIRSAGLSGVDSALLLQVLSAPESGKESGFEGGRSLQNENGFQTRKKEPPFRRNLYKITRFFRQKKRKKACKTLIVLIYY